MKHISNSEQETFDFAKAFAASLKGGEVIGLCGNLGAGKSVFARGLAAGLGIKKKITSPTFVLMNVYPVKHANIKFLCHIDAYRLKGEADLAAIGALDYFGRADTITLIEWADKIKGLLPKGIRLIKLNNLDKEKRLITYLNQSYENGPTPQRL